MPAFAWRISRYDPEARDEQGRYLVDTWTSVSDIGKQWEGCLLTPEAYLSVESAYVDTAIALAVESGAFELTMREVASTEPEQEPLQEIGVPPVDPVPFIEEVRTVPAHRAGNVIRFILRELTWMKLEYGDFYLHFGYDLYMYAGSNVDCPEARRIAQERGLYVESMASPYGH